MIFQRLVYKIVIFSKNKKGRGNNENMLRKFTQKHNKSALSV